MWTSYLPVNFSSLFFFLDDSNLQGKGKFVRISEGFECTREILISIAKNVKENENSWTLTYCIRK